MKIFEEMKAKWCTGCEYGQANLLILDKVKAKFKVAIENKIIEKSSGGLTDYVEGYIKACDEILEML
jgi:hypothetical protein